MSSVTIVPLRLEYLEALPAAKPILDNGLADQVLSIDSVAILRGQKVMVCFGIGAMWSGRGHLWAAFNETPEAKQNFVPVFRAIKRWLDGRIKSSYHRIEMSIDYGLELAERRARLLGFELETQRAKKLMPDGKDATVYVMVRG